MKLHDLRPAKGSRKARQRVGRGIAAGQGKTAGRGTKGQKARAGGSIPARFEGGQTPLHVRIPKLRGFKNKFKVQYEIVNLGSIGRLVELGAFEPGELPGATKAAKTKTKAAPITINQEILRGTGLVRSLDKPMKVLGTGEIGAPVFLVADAFSRTAIAKIEAAGGTVSILEVPDKPLAALGVGDEARATTEPDEAPTEAIAEDSKPATPRKARAPKRAAAAPEAAAEAATEAVVEAATEDAPGAASEAAPDEAVAEAAGENDEAASDAVDTTDA